MLAHGAWHHAVGGWLPPLGIRLRLDGLAASFLVATAVVACGVAGFSRRLFEPSARRETRAGFAFWPLFFVMWAGLNAVFLGADLFNLYVALELLTLTAVAMVALDGKAETLAAAIRYLLFALLGSLAYLLGVALLYARYGALDLGLLRAAAVPDAITLAAGAIMTAGLMAKTAIFPLHGWLPPAHAGAPTPASAMLSALVVKASFYLIARLWFDVLPAAATVETSQLFGALGAGAIVFGSLLALRQEQLKLVIAYSTVAQLGYLFLMFPLTGSAAAPQPWAAAAWTGGMFHALAHAPAKAAMFLAAGLMIKACGDGRLAPLAGIGRDLPIACFAFGLAAVSLMGLPPSGGFTAKYLLLTAALASGQWWWALAILAGGLLAAAYLFRVLNRFLIAPAEAAPRVAVARRDQAIALALAGVSILLGLASLVPYQLLQIGRPAAAVGGLS
ncbi:MAG: proton-conducting transporter membrane subunit [Xanthobacteraceae bacterium]|nr:proton-conducting transporter membrane subunit [Xanthobacteraceae bacterium]